MESLCGWYFINMHSISLATIILTVILHQHLNENPIDKQKNDITKSDFFNKNIKRFNKKLSQFSIEFFVFVVKCCRLTRPVTGMNQICSIWIQWFCIFNFFIRSFCATFVFLSHYVIEPNELFLYLHSFDSYFGVCSHHFD